jgi:hypothetical protein
MIHLKYKILSLAALISLSVILSTGNANAQVAPAPAAPGSSLDQRIAQRKAERNVVLAPNDTKRLTTACLASQGKIRIIHKNNAPIIESRTSLYNHIDATLWVVIGKLKLGKNDTFTLEKNRQVYSDKLSAFNGTAAAYQQTLDDTALINCAADPTGFRALLDTAKMYRTQLREQSVDTRNYLINDVKSTLSTHATDLKGSN